MAVSRRMFLQQGVLAAAACAGTPLMAGTKRPIGSDSQNREKPSPASSGSGNWQDHAAAFDHLGRGQFSNVIGTSFKVTLEGVAQPVFVTLTGVNDLPPLAPVNQASFAVPNSRSGVVPATSGFLLLFSSSSPLPQGTHLFQHSELGNFALFTVPAGNGQQTYIGTVNRLDQIVAVPFVQPGAGTSVPAGATAAPATSSAPDNLPRGLSGSSGVRRAAVTD